MLTYLDIWRFLFFLPELKFFTFSSTAKQETTAITTRRSRRKTETVQCVN